MSRHEVRFCDVCGRVSSDTSTKRRKPTGRAFVDRSSVDSQIVRREEWDLCIPCYRKARAAVRKVLGKGDRKTW